jgi:hypothetical protein
MVMRGPAMSKYGSNYEKDAILNRIGNGNGTCPITGKPLSIRMN